MQERGRAIIDVGVVRSQRCRRESREEEEREHGRGDQTRWRSFVAVVAVYALEYVLDLALAYPEAAALSLDGMWLSSMGEDTVVSLTSVHSGHEVGTWTTILAKHGTFVQGNLKEG